MRTYYRRGEIVPFEEDLHHEFKGHRTISVDNRLIVTAESAGFAQGELGEFSNTRQQWSKYLCGMINTGVGGTLYGGIQDDGRVTGFMMSQYQIAHVIVQLQDVLERFEPPVFRDNYTVRFLPILDDGDDNLPDVAVSDPSLNELGKKQEQYILRCKILLMFLQIITTYVQSTDVGVTTRPQPLTDLVTINSTSRHSEPLNTSHVRNVLHILRD